MNKLSTNLMLLALFCALPLLAYSDNSKIPDYEDGFTFKKGGLYAKDPNIWVYTKAFAQRFGMPAQWVDEKLEGIEAAAWRVEPAETICGWARQEDACKVERRCVLDLYIDTTKHKLPWAPDARALDYSPKYTSLWILRPQNDEKRREPTRGGGRGGNKSPFVDPESGEEAFYYIYHRDTTDRKAGSENFILYEKMPYDGLAMVSLHGYGCFGATGNPEELRFELQSREQEENSSFDRPLHKFHTFILPKSFDAKIQEKRKVFNELTHQFYKNVWENRK